MHECLNEFEFRQDHTIDYGIIFPWASEQSTYNLVATLAPLFSIRSSFLQVYITKTTLNISDELEFRLDPITDCGVSCH